MKRGVRRFVRGSILAYSLILLGIVLVASIGMMSASITNFRAVSSSNRSTNAFQIADSGAQAMIAKIKESDSSDRIRTLFVPTATCNNGGPVNLLGGNYRLTFYGRDPVERLNCNDAIAEITLVKSVGTYRDVARAVQVSVSYTAKLIGHWKMNNNADDETSDNNDGTLGMTVLPTFVGGPPNYALDFGGADSVMTIDNESNFDLRRTISISLWFRADSLPAAWTPLVSKMDGNGSISSRSFSVWLHTLGFVHLTSSDTTGTQSCTDTNDSVVTAGLSWYHYVGIIDRDSGIMSIFINGLPVSSGTTPHHCLGSGAFPPGLDAQQNNEPVRIGGYFPHPPTNDYSVFDGQIDDVRIYDGVLTNAEVTNLYNTGRE